MAAAGDHPCVTTTVAGNPTDALQGPFRALERLSATRLVISRSTHRSGMVLLVLAAALTLLTAAAVAFGVETRPGPRDMLHDWP